MQNLLNFIITEYSKQFDDDLRIYVEKQPLWPLYNWRYKDLPMPHDQKVMTFGPPMENCPTSIKELFLLPKFDNSSFSVTRDKEICQSHVIMR